MPAYKITLNSRLGAAKLQHQISKAFPNAWGISVAKAAPTPTSRAGRLEAAVDLITQGKDEVEELRSEMEQWFDSIPENLQNGDKAREVEECKDALENIHSELDALDYTIDFPGMF